MLICEKICKSFGGIHALVNVDIQFPPSGIVAVIGPNGAGKTTLLNVLTGFVRPDSGHCFWGKREITRLPPYSITRLGIARTFQDLRLINQMSLLDNVLLACPSQKGEQIFAAISRIGTSAEESANLEEAVRLLQFVGLKDKANDFVSDLSYGQQKLLTLATCLATKAQILFLDEPFAGVHPEMITRILEALKLLRNEDKLVIFIEHDLEVVRRLADLLIVMDHGTVIAQGDPNEVLRRAEILEAYLG